MTAPTPRAAGRPRPASASTSVSPTVVALALLLALALSVLPSAAADKPDASGDAGQGNDAGRGGNGSAPGGQGPTSEGGGAADQGQGQSQGGTQGQAHGDAGSSGDAGTTSEAGTTGDDGQAHGPGGAGAGSGPEGVPAGSGPGHDPPASNGAAAGADPGAGGDGAQPGIGAGHAPAAGPRRDAPSDGTDAAPAPGGRPPAVVTDASDALTVQRGRAGNRLAWSVPAEASQVQVWRLDSDGWVPVALAAGAAGQLTDEDGGGLAQYRVTWSSEALGSEALATAATTLPFVDASRALGDGGIGPWLAAVMWAGIGAFGLVRANLPRRVLESRPGGHHPVVPLLAGLPGIDVQTLERVSAFGLRTVAQLRSIDADALAFWARVPATMVRHWKDTLDVLVWPALPPGAGERLALAGHGSLAHLAAARPSELLPRLRGQTGVEGPGLPADEGELANWVIEARLALGLDQHMLPDAGSATGAAGTATASVAAPAMGTASVAAPAMGTASVAAPALTTP